jgi:hypothetical protein
VIHFVPVGTLIAERLPDGSVRARQMPACTPLILHKSRMRSSWTRSANTCRDCRPDSERPSPNRPDQMIQSIFFAGKSARQSVKIHHQPLLASIIYPN